MIYLLIKLGKSVSFYMYRNVLYYWKFGNINIYKNEMIYSL